MGKERSQQMKVAQKQRIEVQESIFNIWRYFTRFLQERQVAGDTIYGFEHFRAYDKTGDLRWPKYKNQHHISDDMDMVQLKLSQNHVIPDAEIKTSGVNTKKVIGKMVSNLGCLYVQVVNPINVTPWRILRSPTVDDDDKKHGVVVDFSTKLLPDPEVKDEQSTVNLQVQTILELNLDIGSTPMWNWKIGSLRGRPLYSISLNEYATVVAYYLGLYFPEVIMEMILVWYWKGFDNYNDNVMKSLFNRAKLVT